MKSWTFPSWELPVVVPLFDCERDRQDLEEAYQTLAANPGADSVTLADGHVIEIETQDG